MECRFWYRASLVALLAGCAPGSGMTPSSSLPAPAAAARVGDRSTATVVIKLPPIHKAGTPIDWSINSLSSSTKSATVRIGKHAFGPIVLNASNPHCVHASAGLTCTLVVKTTAGKYGEIIVHTFATGVKQPLGFGHTAKYGSVNLLPGRNVLPIDVASIAHTIKVIPATTTLTQGHYFFDQLSSEAFDVQHHLIPTRYVVSPKGHPFVVLYSYSGFSMGTVSWDSYYYNCCGDKPVFPYDGVAVGTETVTGTAYSGPYSENYADVPQATAKLTVVPGNTDLAPVAMGIAIPVSYGLHTIAQFATTPSSSTGPTRQFLDTYQDPESGSYYYKEPKWPLYGEDTSGNFWIGNVKFSNALAVLGTVTLPSYVKHVSARDYKGHLYGNGPQQGSGASGCAIYEFPHRFGALNPIREIDGPGCSSPIAFDSVGNVYVADEIEVPVSGGYANELGVQEFPPKGSGHIAAIHTMIPPRGDDLKNVIGLDLDDAGNVYVGAQYYIDNAPSRQIYKFAPGQTTGALQLDGLKVDGFVVNGAGDIYAQVASPTPSVTEIQEFAPGATTPMQTFGGTSGTSYGLPILLPRFPP
ncbi:MAG TPA: hypothetical protein VFE36_06005 [Candidatus Baltobacteraceae bacterium]|jgi:hypothetical protein|nr:hypothetical protein [Candidatus Baltobacteraceae bacterium]